MPADPPFGTYADERTPIPSAEGTSNPVWIIVSGKNRSYLAGPWFSRAAAERYLRAKSYDMPRTAFVFCASGHMSADYVHLCKTGRVPDGR